MRDIRAWGRIGPCLQEPKALDPTAIVLSGPPGIAHGLGRSYGDVALNPGGTLWLTSALSAFRAFDSASGRLTVEAGVSLAEIERLFVPRGFRLAVMPGTAFVTVGGAIANDVHGKNHHHHGSFGDHVLAISLLRSDGTHHELTRQSHPELFAATIGGLGLTGLIVTATVQLIACRTPWLETERLVWSGLDEFLALSQASEADWEHTVGWFDCRSPEDPRGLFTRAREAQAADLPAPQAEKRQRAVPLTAPVSLVNGLSLALFNRAYAALGRRQSGKRSYHTRQAVLQPLDHLAHWNRLYGPRGFYQYQVVLPQASAREGVIAMLAAIRRSGQGSMLAVLKTFGERTAPGLMSFVRPGVTLALDFPNRGTTTAKLFSQLDAITAEAGGRLYPAKDMLMPPALFARGFPRLAEFLTHRDPGFSSGLSRRLIGS